LVTTSCPPAPAGISLATIPPPAKVREELHELFRAVRLTRSLLKLSERIYAASAASTNSVEAAHAAR
jgi:hypothetical protein